METFYSVTLLIVAAIISNIIASAFDKIPLTFFEIACGFALSFLPLFHHYSLYPEMFMICIIAPLLYTDGTKANLKQFRTSLGQLFSMAVFLAIATAILMGILFHSLMTIVPLTLSIMLAAIITPTDSLALSSITTDIKIPHHVSGALENESLFNDASGIVVFNLAILTFSTGDFSLANGLASFSISFFGGIFIGLIVGLLFYSLQGFLISKSMDTSTVLVPLNLMSPIATYLVAEEFHASGILAVVAAGILHGLYSSRLRLTSTDVQLVIKASWQVVSSLLSGIVFVLLGVTIPTVISKMTQFSNHFLMELLVLAVVLYLGMLMIRFMWAKFNLVNLHPDTQTKNSTKDSFLIAIGGIHGTITLSMALSIPFTINGHDFPFRDEIIFVATIVILLSLVVPTFVLPLILDRRERHDDASFNSYRNQMVNYSIQQIRSDPTINLVDRNYVMDLLDSQKKQGTTNKKQVQEIMNQINSIQYQTIVETLGDNKIDRKLANFAARRFLVNPNRPGGIFKKIGFFIRLTISKRWARKAQRKFVERDPEEHKESRAALRDQLHALRAQIEDEAFSRVNEYLDEIESMENSNSVSFVRRSVTFRHMREDADHETDVQRNELLIKALQFEYQFVSERFRQGNIDKELSDRLNQSIATDQMVYLQSVETD
ncbi:sodium:proton antiporter [Lentilactobacillus curieae]|uniref:Sodium:proton antiporter n=1 Tax=Lentilactobacillus curieae TaxID=1138822 RepID=A0A1S6QGW8_9LACO|nr:sodium:proton antiporter [Lentilactobacillus curieae]AQW20850.1 sodium:proton antiporter [Lentilactobacillus curieae]